VALYNLGLDHGQSRLVAGPKVIGGVLMLIFHASGTPTDSSQG